MANKIINIPPILLNEESNDNNFLPTFGYIEKILENYVSKDSWLELTTQVNTLNGMIDTMNATINGLKAKLDEKSTIIDTLWEQAMPHIGEYKYITYGLSIPFNWIRVPPTINWCTQLHFDNINGDNLDLVNEKSSVGTASNYTRLRDKNKNLTAYINLQLSTLIHYNPNIYALIYNSGKSEQYWLDLYNAETYSDSETTLKGMEHYLDWLKEKLG